MASVPLAQPVDLGRFSVHYSMSSESHDRGHSSANHTQTHTPVHQHQHQHRQSPTSSSAREHASPRGGFDSPSSLPTSAPTHQTSFGLEQSDSALTSDGGGSLPHSSPAMTTWQATKSSQSQSESQAQAQVAQSQAQQQAQAQSMSQAFSQSQSQLQPQRDTMGGGPFTPQFPSYNPQYRPDMQCDTYPRAAPYYMPIGPMHTLESQRDLAYERKRVEDQIRREREIAKSRRHVCPVCEKRFNRPSSLNTHMSVHTGAKPYQCTREGCGRRFSVSSNLRRHERTHEARARPVIKQEPSPQHTTTTVYSSPAQPTVFLQTGPPPPPNISYPYTYHSASHTHTHAHANTHSFSSSTPAGGFPVAQRYAYHLGGGGSMPPSSTRDYHYPSLIHHRDTASFASTTNGANNGSGAPSSGNSAGNGNGNGNNNSSGGGGARSQSATPPSQQSILMPQPTKPNTLMLG